MFVNIVKNMINYTFEKLKLKHTRIIPKIPKVTCFELSKRKKTIVLKNKFRK